MPCGKRKIWDRKPQARPTAAREVYIGPFAQKCREYAEAFYPDDWYILSAKYGFLDPFDIIPEPYDVTFNDPSTNPISIAELTIQAASMGLLNYERIVVLGGKRYLDIVEHVFTSKKIEAPLAGCTGIGGMMHRLDELMNR